MIFRDNKLIKVWYLEMVSIKDFKHSKLPTEVKVVKQEIPYPSLNRYFYIEVGKKLYWTDRRKWSIEEWSEWVFRDDVSTWILIVKGTPAGYFELNTQDNEVEIAHFGLLTNFIGKGYGGGFLSYAIEKAWEQNKKRIWVHTCSLDHPKALKNYMDRGFKIFKEIEKKYTN